jgi:hypothetical protein
MTAESSSKSAADAESDTPRARWTRRLRRVPLRLVLGRVSRILIISCSMISV